MGSIDNSGHRSQIQYVDGRTRQPRLDVDIGNVLVSSQDLDWQGIHIETGENDGFESNDVTVLQHYFAMNIGQPYEWQWKDGDRFRTEYRPTGCMWINPAGIPFSHRLSGQNKFALLTIAPEQLVEALPEQPHVDHQAFMRVHSSNDPQIYHTMNALLSEAAAGNPNGKLYVETLATALSIHYMNHYSLKPSIKYPIDSAHIKSDDRKRIHRVIDYVEAFLAEDISLADLALVAGRSKFHFSRLFKTAIGLTPHQYLMKRRVERAAEAMKARTESLADIALSYGFSDQTHFTRNFKKFKGVTPKQFLDR